MKRKIQTLLLLACYLFCACSSEDIADIPSPDNNEPVYLKISFGAQTYAHAADPQEKELHSVAFFIQTAQGGF